MYNFEKVNMVLENLPSPLQHKLNLKLVYLDKTIETRKTILDKVEKGIDAAMKDSDTRLNLDYAMRLTIDNSGAAIHDPITNDLIRSTNPFTKKVIANTTGWLYDKQYGAAKWIITAFALARQKPFRYGPVYKDAAGKSYVEYGPTIPKEISQTTTIIRETVDEKLPESISNIGMGTIFLVIIFGTVGWFAFTQASKKGKKRKR